LSPEGRRPIRRENNLKREGSIHQKNGNSCDFDFQPGERKQAVHRRFRTVCEPVSNRTTPASEAEHLKSEDVRAFTAQRAAYILPDAFFGTYSATVPETCKTNLHDYKEIVVTSYFAKFFGLH